MKQTRLCIVTMVGPIDLIGDLVTGSEGTQSNWADLEHACMLRMAAPSQMVLHPMTGTLQLNMRTVLWISEPSRDLLSHYKAQRAGIVMPAGPRPESRPQ